MTLADISSSTSGGGGGSGSSSGSSSSSSCNSSSISSRGEGEGEGEGSMEIVSSDQVTVPPYQPGPLGFQDQALTLTPSISISGDGQDSNPNPDSTLCPVRVLEAYQLLQRSIESEGGFGLDQVPVGI